MRIRTKFLAQWVIAGCVAWALKFILGAPDLYIPGIQTLVDFGWWYVPIAAFIIVSESNAVNFTDGLDGLAGLICATVPVPNWRKSDSIPSEKMTPFCGIRDSTIISVPGSRKPQTRPA